MFTSNRQATNVEGLYRKPANGAIPEQLVLPPEAGNALNPRDWSLDGRWFIFGRQLGGGGGIEDIWLLDLMGNLKASPYLRTSYSKLDATAFSRRPLAGLRTNESGKLEVVVQTFPDPALGKWKVSTGTGGMPRWRGDGRELFYLDEQSRMIAVTIEAGRTFAIGKSTVLFKTPLPPQLTGPQGNYLYDVSADGQRFLFAPRPEALTAGSFDSTAAFRGRSRGLT
jgi:hypothetical protein